MYQLIKIVPLQFNVFEKDQELSNI